MGYTNVHVYTEGFPGWESRGLAVKKGRRPGTWK
jgi:rhodanese-related sulfurtransferase